MPSLDRKNRTREGLGKDFPNWRTSEQDIRLSTEKPRERPNHQKDSLMKDFKDFP